MRRSHLLATLVAKCSLLLSRAAAVAPVLLGACGSAPVAVAPVVVEAEEQRLLQPFRVRRDVVAHSVDVTLSANFLQGSRVGDADIEHFGTAAGNRVALPVADKALHDHDSTRGEQGTIESYRNRLGGTERPLRLVVGATHFQALQAMTVRVLPGGAPLTLDVVANGDVTVLAGSERVDVPQLEIKDGLWRGQ
jgi:hypothetical protein